MRIIGTISILCKKMRVTSPRKVEIKAYRDIWLLRFDKDKKFRKTLSML